MDATEGSHEPWDHSDDWESYEGTVIIPAGQSRTMIAYRGVAKDGTLTASANDSIIDDLSFRLAYKLSYDANGGTGQVPSRTETGRTETAASGTDGTVRLAADKSAGPESGTIADDRRVLTDTTARQDDGTSPAYDHPIRRQRARGDDRRRRAPYPAARSIIRPAPGSHWRPRRPTPTAGIPARSARPTARSTGGARTRTPTTGTCPSATPWTGTR